MATLGSRIDRLERAHLPHGTPHPTDGDGAAVLARVLAGEVAVRDLSDAALLTLLADDTLVREQNEEIPHDDRHSGDDGGALCPA